MTARAKPTRRRVHTLLGGAALGALMGGPLLLAGCGGDAASGSALVVEPDGTSTVDAELLDTQLATYALTPLSAAEADSLATMRQEEQLAHDVYRLSAGLWGTPVFARIADSEATHSAAIKALLDRHGLPDPLAGYSVGTFATPAFQTLYDAFAAASHASLVAALSVGAQVEELDIRDLTLQRTRVVHPDILLVYDHLLRGSRNHLRAFVRLLLAQGVPYTPVYLDAAVAEAIVNSPVETGP